MRFSNEHFLVQSEHLNKCAKASLGIEYRIIMMHTECIASYNASLRALSQFEGGKMFFILRLKSGRLRRLHGDGFRPFNYVPHLFWMACRVECLCLVLLFGSSCFWVMPNCKGIRKPSFGWCCEEFADLPTSAHGQKKSGGFSPNGPAIFM